MRNVLNLGSILILIGLIITIGQSGLVKSEGSLNGAGTNSTIEFEQTDTTQSQMIMEKKKHEEKSSLISKEQISIALLIILLGATAFILQHSLGTIRTE